MQVALLTPDVEPEDLGLLPYFLSENDPRPAAEQFNEKYAHGGGWQPIPGCTLKGLTMRYPGDPPFKAIAMMKLRDEVVLIYEHSLVAILQPDGTFAVARMD
jgi:hypothetical protein